MGFHYLSIPKFSDFEDEGFRPTLYDGFDYLTIY